jgi:hypothetical protein
MRPSTSLDHSVVHEITVCEIALDNPKSSRTPQVLSRTPVRRHSGWRTEMRRCLIDSSDESATASVFGAR